MIFQRKMTCLAIWHYVQCDIGNWNHTAFAIAICSDDDACIKEREYEREITTKKNKKNKINKEPKIGKKAQNNGQSTGPNTTSQPHSVVTVKAKGVGVIEQWVTKHETSLNGYSLPLYRLPLIRCG